MTDNLIESVSDTAFWIANYRAVETERGDALFRDPLAARLAGERGKKIASSMPMPAFTGWMVVIRTCIIDDYLKEALAQGVDLIVNLGAGLDTRPYRMELPASLQWVEVDYARVIEYKEKLLAGEKPRCRLERVKLDLSDVDLRRQLFARLNSQAKKILVLTEGVVPYLSEEQAGALAADLKAMTQVRYWIIDYLSPATHAFRKRSSMQDKMRNAPFRFNPEDWFAFFSALGWRSTQIRYLAPEGKRLRRPVPLPFIGRFLIRLKRIFSSAERRAGFNHFAGYVLLEP